MRGPKGRTKLRPRSKCTGHFGAHPYVFCSWGLAYPRSPYAAGCAGAYPCHCACFRHLSPGERWYSLNNKWLCGPPSESGQKQLCLRPESNRSRIVRELSRLISVTYLELILWCRVYGFKIHKNWHLSTLLINQLRYVHNCWTIH
jgi:hypothetical protein